MDIREILGNVTSGGEEETVGHLHDGSLVDDADLGLANRLGILETEAEHTLRGGAGDKLDGLDNAINNLVLDTGVLSLGVLTDENGVDIVVWSLEAGDGTARTDVGEEVEGAAESQVEGDVALADGGLEKLSEDVLCGGGVLSRPPYSKGTLKGDIVALDGLDRGVRNGGLAVFKDGSNVAELPINGSL